MRTECQAPMGGSDDERVTGHRGLGAAIVGSRDEAPPFYGGQGGPGEFDEWVEEGRKGVPSSAKPICTKAQRQVSRHVRGQRGERERGEEGTGGEPGPHGLGSAC